MSLSILIGPPGTGKTFALLRIVEQALASGVSPDRIGYVSFSRKAAREAAERAVAQFKLSRSKFKYFRTLHSLAFLQLGLTKKRVLDGVALEDFADYCGMHLTTSHFDEDSQYQMATPDDQMMFMMNLARVRRRKLRDEYDQGKVDVPWRRILQVQHGLTTFKRDRKLVDYTDMLEQFIVRHAEHGMIPELDLLCIDEAQDLSRLQWDMVRLMFPKARDVYVAGDDDQAIFGWAGADVESFHEICTQHPVKVLDQSYRVPVKVQGLAHGVIGRCKSRVPKTWNPRAEAGNVHMLPHYDHAPLDQGQWLVLARNAHSLSEVYGFLYHNIPDWKARITVSTIHRAKGGEAENVLLFTDMARRSFEGITTDEEQRVFYVAVTRARNALYVVSPQTAYFYDILSGN